MIGPCAFIVRGGSRDFVPYILLQFQALEIFPRLFNPQS